MERTQVRLYNILLPIWLLWIFPQAWLVILPGNLAIDCAVLLLALAALRCAAKGAVLRRTWWRVWLNGFLADAAGVAWMVLGMFAAAYGGAWWEENLTAITGREEFFIKHVWDSLAGEKYFPCGASVAEVGSGGGFPSLPLKICRPDLEFTLFESVGKKCAFLKYAAGELALSGVEVVNARAEDAGKGIYREKFGACCARAVARLNTLLEYCAPLVKVGGIFIAYKGEAGDEIKEAANAAKILGISLSLLR